MSGTMSGRRAAGPMIAGMVVTPGTIISPGTIVVAGVSPWAIIWSMVVSAGMMISTGAVVSTGAMVIVIPGTVVISISSRTIALIVARGTTGGWTTDISLVTRGTTHIAGAGLDCR